MKVAQRMAQKSAAVPELWARCLLGHCYGLWFLCLPAYVRSASSRVRALHTAYHVLRQMESRKVVLPDEVGTHASSRRPERDTWWRRGRADGEHKTSPGAGQVLRDIH